MPETIINDKKVACFHNIKKYRKIAIMQFWFAFLLEYELQESFNKYEHEQEHLYLEHYRQLLKNCGFLIFELVNSAVMFYIGSCRRLRELGNTESQLKTFKILLLKKF